MTLFIFLFIARLKKDFSALFSMVTKMQPLKWKWTRHWFDCLQILSLLDVFLKQCFPKTGPPESLNWSLGIFFWTQNMLKYDSKYKFICEQYYWSTEWFCGPRKKIWILWSATWKSLGNTALKFYWLIRTHFSLWLIL